MAFDLGEQSWKLAMTVGLGQKPRVRTMRAGERKLWSVVRVPSIEEEDARHLHRPLGTLEQEQTRLINRIKGLLASQGLRGQPRRRDFLPGLEQARLWDGSPLPAGLRSRIDVESRRLEFVRSQIRELEQERKRLLQQSEAASVEKVRRLMELKGIGTHCAWGWLRHQPESVRSRWYERRFAQGPPRLRRIGIVALARKLLIALCMWTEHGIVPEGAEIAA